MTHVVERTSPKGQAFVGKCVKCGKQGLGMGGALEPCPKDGDSTAGEDLLRAIQGPEDRD